MATHAKKAAIPGRGRGRPCLYRQEYADVAYEMTALNYTTADLAEEFGVDIRTITNWENKFLEFRNALTRGRVDNRRRQGRETYEEMLARFGRTANGKAPAQAPAPRRASEPALPRAAEPNELPDWLSHNPLDPVPMDDILDQW